MNFTVFFFSSSDNGLWNMVSAHSNWIKETIKQDTSGDTNSKTNTNGNTNGGANREPDWDSLGPAKWDASGVQCFGDGCGAKSKKPKKSSKFFSLLDG